MSREGEAGTRSGPPGRTDDTLRLVHHHPGRVRLRAGALREGAPRAEAVVRALRELPGLRRVERNGFTGSVLVEYEPGEVEPDTIVATALDAAGLARLQDETRERGDPQALVPYILRAVRTLNEVTDEATDGHADLRTLVPGALFAVGLYSLARKPTLPAWYTMFFWSYRFFVELNDVERPPEAPREER